MTTIKADIDGIASATTEFLDHMKIQIASETRNKDP